MTQPAAHEPVVPLSTYRLQMNGRFRFTDAADVVPYLAELGITDLYASPYLKARPGSLHGYDISDHSRLNDEIGSEAEHERLMRLLQEHRMGHLLDIVPNHMGIGQTDNRWWMDVLENGQSSPYAPYFDIDWTPIKPELAGKVLLPVLGDQFGRILEQGELQVEYEGGRFRIRYHEHVYPVSPKAAGLILREALERVGGGEEGEEARIELESIVTALDHLPVRTRTDEASIRERRRESLVTRRRVAALHESSDRFRKALEAALDVFNGTPGDPHSFDLLERLLDDQPYRLAFWRVAAEEINYRRFFDINDLAGVRVEIPRVFEDTHRLILGFVEQGKVTGLRIDHPDGLFDPTRYLQELQRQASRRSGRSPFYILVEKILTGDERLPEDWPVAGAVGYEFLNRVSGLFIRRDNEARINEVYGRFIQQNVRFSELVYGRKRLILRVALASELNVLAYHLDRISESNRRYRDFTLGSLTDALREVVASFPVYRTYIDADSGRVSETDRQYVEQAVRTAIRRNRASSPTLFRFIRDILLLEWPDDLSEQAREEHAYFVMKFQQLTGPVMAKGLEDTSFYIFNRMISLNEVGGEPDHFGIAPDAFHAWIRERGQRWPLAMNSSSTHDTKRSEDVRARIHVLSEIPDEWEIRVRHWAELNEGKKEVRDGDPIPDLNDEYLLYQTLVGAWPLESADEAGHAEFVGRIQQYMEKATREAKVHTSWINPNEDYDEALRGFVARILERPESNPFVADLREFAPGIARCGMLNSLSQTLLKLTCPGVPDVYQGQEMWDFSLVDPDNRRPVDFETRKALLASIRARTEGGRGTPELARELISSWEDGRIKLFLTHLTLRLRKSDPSLFRWGTYTPVGVSGPRGDRVIAFARAHEGRRLIVVAPRFWSDVAMDGLPEDFEAVWEGTELEGADDLVGGGYRNLFDGTRVSATSGRLPLAGVLGRFPVGLLLADR